ncbi:MAG: insulinase family protein [Gemmatimonadetes bacterium]|nr:insulinase family protein [Gemmatimonadota bacterium]
MRIAHLMLLSTLRGLVPGLLLAPSLLLAQDTVSLGHSGTTDGRELPVVEHVLANGMRFLLLHREGAPIVSFVVYVPVGSVNESHGETGISHFVEHLLFKGTTTIGTRDVEAERVLFRRMDAAHDSLVRERGRLPEPDPLEVERLGIRIASLEDSARVFVVPNEYSQILSRNGARGLNATTSLEATQYFVDLPANRAELWFALEADRIRNPVFREFFTERAVILEERRARVDSSPEGFFSEAYLAAAFQVHPYGVPPSGYPNDIQALTRSRVEEYLRRYYGPRNMTVAIVGNFDPDSARVWADRYFGPIPPGDPVPLVLAREPEQGGERRIEVLFDADPQLRIGWTIPSAIDPEGPALNMLANLLVAGRDSRLYRRLVREGRLASAVTVETGPGSLYPGIFTIQAIPLAPHTPEEVEAAIYEELERLIRAPPTEDELAPVRTRLEASGVRRLTSNQGLAFQLASSQSIWGDWRETFSLQDRMRRVDAEDIVELVERYLTPERRTVAILHRREAP